MGGEMSRVHQTPVALAKALGTKGVQWTSRGPWNEALRERTALVAVGMSARKVQQ